MKNNFSFYLVIFNSGLLLQIKVTWLRAMYNVQVMLKFATPVRESLMSIDLIKSKVISSHDTREK